MLLERNCSSRKVMFRRNVAAIREIAKKQLTANSVFRKECLFGNPACLFTEEGFLQKKSMVAEKCSEGSTMICAFLATTRPLSWRLQLDVLASLPEVSFLGRKLTG